MNRLLQQPVHQIIESYTCFDTFSKEVLYKLIISCKLLMSLVIFNLKLHVNRNVFSILSRKDKFQIIILNFVCPPDTMT